MIQSSVSRTLQPFCAVFPAINRWAIFTPSRFADLIWHALIDYAKVTPQGCVLENSLEGDNQDISNIRMKLVGMILKLGETVFC